LIKKLAHISKAEPQTKKQERASEDYNISFDFATKVYKKFQELIKSIVLFGSVAKQRAIKGSDVDIILFVDDCTIKWDEELISWYREELGRLIAKQEYKKILHVNTVTISTFWDEVRAGEPLAINIIRYGEAIIDHGGFFEPLKVLLAKGKIRPTPEAIFTTLSRAEEHLTRANNSLLASVEGFYWGCVDAAHAALMAENVIPPSPEFISDLLNDFFIKSGKLNKKYLSYFEDIQSIIKEINRGEKQKISAHELKDLEEKAHEFIRTLRDITKVIIKDKKIIKIEPKKD